jgi:hypothetical protein
LIKLLHLPRGGLEVSSIWTVDGFALEGYCNNISPAERIAFLLKPPRTTTTKQDQALLGGIRISPSGCSTWHKRLIGGKIALFIPFVKPLRASTIVPTVAVAVMCVMFRQVNARNGPFTAKPSMASTPGIMRTNSGIRK